MRAREQQHNQLMRQQPMMPGQMPLGVRRAGNGMVPPNLQKTALNNGLYAPPLAYFRATFSSDANRALFALFSTGLNSS